MACVSGRGVGAAGDTVIHTGPRWGVQGQLPATEPPGQQPDSQDGRLVSRESKEEKVPALPVQG